MKEGREGWEGGRQGGGEKEGDGYRGRKGERKEKEFWRYRVLI